MLPALAADLLDFFSEQVRLMYGLPGGAMRDPLAVAVLLDPELVQFQPMHVAIELRGEHTYGMTICDQRPRGAVEHTPAIAANRRMPPNAEVAVAVNPERF
jgi:purine nucleosidase